MNKSMFLLCVNNEGCPDLEPRKVYQQLPDQKGDPLGFVRVVDESGEDYLYAAKHFVTVRLNKQAQALLTENAA